MRIKQNGQQYQQDMPIQNHAAAQGIDMRWHGDLEQTRAYYARLTIPFENFTRLRQADFNHHFDPAKLQAVLDAVNALAEEVSG